MNYDLVIFDLDGTLLNTLEDLAAATNAALAEFGFPTHGIDEVRRYIGGGVARLMHRAVPEGTNEVIERQTLARFKSIYMAHVNERTAPYPGIPELLDALRLSGIRTAVNSNKVDRATQLLAAAHFPGKFDMVLGDRDGLPKKPAPDGARRIMAALGIAPERTLYVGDGDADILTAENAGIDGAWVSWGYRTRAELQGIAIPRAFNSAAALGDFILGR